MHEIDIIVTVEADGQNREIYMFECKNRKSKVSKDDIIILNHKILDYKRKELHDPNASVKGVFVGKSFSSFARKKAIELGIQLIKANDILDPLKEPGVSYLHENEITYVLGGYNSLMPYKLAVIYEHTPAISLGKKENVQIHKVGIDLFTPQVEKLIDDFTSYVWKNGKSTGIYSRSYLLIQKLKETLYCDGVVVNTIKLHLSIKLWFSVGNFESGFDVQGKKRLITRHLTLPSGEIFPVYFISLPST